MVQVTCFMAALIVGKLACELNSHCSVKSFKDLVNFKQAEDQQRTVLVNLHHRTRYLPFNGTLCFSRVRESQISMMQY